MKKFILGLLSLSTLLYASPPVWAQGERGTKTESEEYARREAQAPSLENFQGGHCSNGEVVLKVIFFFIYVWVLLIDAMIHSAPEPAPEPAPPPAESERK